MASKRTIAHALFTYTDPESGAEQLALRGQTVELSPKDIKRGEKFGAFTSGDGEPERLGSLVDYPLDEGEAEQDAWVRAGKVDEIVAAVNARPEIAASVLEAEGRRGDQARTTLIASLSEFVESSK